MVKLNKKHKHIYVIGDSSGVPKCSKCYKEYKSRPNPNNRVLCEEEIKPSGRIWRRHKCGNWATYKTRGIFTCTRHTYLHQGSEAEKLLF